MSVNTTAKELIQDCRDKIDAALKAVNEACCEIVVKGDCWGADEIGDETKENLESYRGQLLEMKKNL